MTYIKKAEASGNVFVRTKSTATRVRIDNEGKAKSVIYFDRDGVEHEQKASVIIVSAGTIQSPRLLLNSKSKIFPDGLANSSGLVGKYFMQHIGIYSAALFHDRIDSFRGHPSGASSLDFAKSSPTNSFARGWRVDLISGVTTPKMLTNLTSLSGKRLKDYMRTNFGHSAGIITAGEQLPDERNFIELDPEVKDEYGLAVPRITYKWRKNDRSMLAAMEKKIREIYDAAGASEIQYIYSRQGGSSHNMGTCRMGKDRKTSVLNSYCQTHDVSNLFVIDGSCFVTASSVNPSLTIQAIALRASEYIVEQGKKGNLMKL
jgi:choline dehydrogenase-like flavoprotein